jgi:hypothetical protein
VAPADDKQRDYQNISRNAASLAGGMSELRQKCRQPQIGLALPSTAHFKYAYRMLWNIVEAIPPFEALRNIEIATQNF